MARADFSGFAIAHDLGAISPTTKCRKVTTNRAIAKAALPAIQSASPHELSMGPSQKSMAGFVTAPSAKVQKVMPNWEPASIRVKSFMPRRAARADGLVAANSSSRWRRAPSKANSIITKKALRTRSAIVRSEEHTSELQSRGHLVCRLLLE